jgi:hypothetical protein
MRLPGLQALLCQRVVPATRSIGLTIDCNRVCIDGVTGEPGANQAPIALIIIVMLIFERQETWIW